MNRSLAAAGCLLLLAAGTALGQGKAPEPAQKLLEAARKQAKAEKKAVLVVFGASW